jgi:hypothetical protein
MPYTKHTYTGRYVPANPAKYRGNLSDIRYRSSVELRFMKWCDLNTNVLEWGSEEVVIPYISPKDNKPHRYFVDFYIKIKNKDGEVKKYLIEIKPFRFTQEPVVPKRKSQNFIAEVVQWSVNNAKWDAAKQAAKRMGWEFMIITERDLSNM